MSWFLKIIDRCFAVAGALILMQAPEFMQQYQQVLAGQVAELEYQVGLVEQVAAKSGKTMQVYIEKFLESGDADFVEQGKLIEGMIKRCTKMKEALTSLQVAKWWSKPFRFVATLQPPVAKTAYTHFQPGLALSWEGGLFALIGVILGYGTFHLLTLPFKRKVK